MKTIIIALPVPDDTDIFDVQDLVNERLTPTLHGRASFEEVDDDSILSVTYENAAALLDDLGIEALGDAWWGACGVLRCGECLPRFDAYNNEIEED